MTTAAATSRGLTTSYAHVVMPVDFSPLSWKVLSLAKAMERAVDAPRRLVHVDTSSPWLDEGASRLVLKTGPHGQHVQVEVIAARTAADGIRRVLADDESSLLVMSTHGHSAAAELPVGSTTETLLRSWQGAVLIAGPRYRATRPVVTRIVLCVDPEHDPPARLVADVVTFAEIFDVVVEVVVVHGHDDDRQQERSRVRRVLADVRAAGVMATAVPRSGARVAHEITAYADAQPGTLIALSTHARGLPARLLLGSVAMAVVRHSTSPVLLRRYEVEDHIEGRDGADASTGLPRSR